MFIAGSAQQTATEQILYIHDAPGLPLNTTDIFVRPDDLGSGEDGQYFDNVIHSIVIPIELGKCTYILIEAEGYQDWELAFCPAEAQNLPVNIKLAPVDIPFPGKQTGL